MLLFKMTSFLYGYLVILVTGDAPEKFVNMAASRGIYLWDITRVKENAVILKVRLNAVKPLRHIARRTHCRFRIRRRAGFPFYVVWLRRRKGLALGAVFFLAALYFLSSFVWFVDVKGNEKVSAAEVLEVAGEAGLSRGAPKWKINTVEVEKNIEDKIPLISWTGVYIKGTKVTIEVAERTVVGEEDRRPTHIVAKKSGLIKEILIFSGHPAVKEGDTVVPGQVLISGEIPPPEGQQAPGEEKKPGDTPKITRPSRYVHAKGVVHARVWYEGYGEAELIETIRHFTGATWTCFSMKFRDREIILSGSQNVPFEIYETKTYVKRAPQWRNLDLPVEIVTVKYMELEEYKEERLRDGALKLAEERALEAALEQIPGDARVQERRLEEAITAHPEDLVRVEAVIETIEDIGADRVFNP